MKLTRANTLIDEVTLPQPALPAELEGLRIAHLTDLHIKRPRNRFRKIAQVLADLHADLVLFTGDYMCDLGDEPAAMTVMRDLCKRLRPRLGIFGVFGNHDSALLRDWCQELPVRWLANEAVAIEGLPLHVLGFENDKYRRPDTLALLAAMRKAGEREPGIANGESGIGQARSDAPQRANESRIPNPKSPFPSPPLRLLLSHYPTMLPIAADLGVDVMFSGHTHGGQWRLPWRIAPYTSCDLPSGLCAGVLRHRDTLAVISRGLGETFVPIRFFCRAHLPVFVLHRAPLPGSRTDDVENVLPW